MKTLLFGLLTLNVGFCHAQGVITNNGVEIPVTTAVPFLSINDDARSSGLGEITVVSNSHNPPLHLLVNPSLVAGRKKGFGLKIGYSPWLRTLVKDIYMVDYDFYFAINEKNSIAYNFRFFSLGQIQFTGMNQEDLGSKRPIEFVHQIRYARLLGRYFSLGIGSKFIFSDLASGQVVPGGGGETIKPGKAFAVDLGTDFRKEFKVSESFRYKLNIGLAIQNFGTKIRYTEGSQKDFIPIVLNFGIMNSFKILFNDNNSEEKKGKDSYILINVGYQTDKLMVPTPSTEDDDNNGIYDYRETSVLKGAFTSFADAPGGAKEELHEFTHHIGTGIEAVIIERFLAAFNVGHFFEHENKGNRKYLTWGIAFGFYGFFFDFAHLIPKDGETSPLDKTYKIAFGFNMQLGEGAKLRFHK